MGAQCPWGQLAAINSLWYLVIVRRFCDFVLAPRQFSKSSFFALRGMSSVGPADRTARLGVCAKQKTTSGCLYVAMRAWRPRATPGPFHHRELSRLTASAKQ